MIIDPESDQIIQRIELADIISDKNLSKCRFLHFGNRKLFVVDLGLNCVYVMNLEDMKTRTFGKMGKREGQFVDPAGLVTDSFGNFIVADAGNNRLQASQLKSIFMYLSKTYSQNVVKVQSKCSQNAVNNQSKYICQPFFRYLIVFCC